MGNRQKSAKQKLQILRRKAGITDATLADVTKWLTKKGRKR